MVFRHSASGLIILFGLTGCAGGGWLPDFAPEPPAPPASQPTAAGTPIEIAEIAAVETWTEGHKPTGAEGTRVNAFAEHLNQPTGLHVLPNGDVLVAESATAESSPTGGARITLLRDTDNDGSADLRSVFLEGLSAATGMALAGDQFYVATAEAILRYSYGDGDVRLDGSPTEVVALPKTHGRGAWAGDLLTSRDERKLYATVQSFDQPDARGDRAMHAEIWEVDLEDGTQRVVRRGSAAFVGLAWELESGALWAAVDRSQGPVEQAEAGHVAAVDLSAAAETTSEPPPSDDAVAGDTQRHSLGERSAPSDLVNGIGNTLPARFANGMFVGQHGFDNRAPMAGYEVVFVPFKSAAPAGEPLQVLAGFIDNDGNILGRPVAVAVDSHGALLVADDTGNRIWRLISAPGPAS